MEHKQKGVLIIGLGILMLGGLALLVSSYTERKQVADVPALMYQEPGEVPGEVKMEESVNDGVTIQEPIEQWKVCRNEKVGYEVKYPSEWQTYHSGPYGFIPDTCSTTHSFVVGPDETIQGVLAAHNTHFFINYVDTSLGSDYPYWGIKSLEEYLQQNSGYQDRIYKKGTIDGVPAVWVKYSAKDSAPTELITFGNSKVVFIKRKGLSPESFDLFLSTFRFLK